jgi:hypothetical protein
MRQKAPEFAVPSATVDGQLADGWLGQNGNLRFW